MDITNQQFNRLIALSFNHRDSKGYHWWLFQCNCGTKVLIRKLDVVKGKSKSCGCFRRELMKKNAVERFTKHGMLAKGSSIRDFRTKWIALRSRCKINVKNYGSRGITFDQRWLSFENFKEDMYPSYLVHKERFGANTSLERVDNNLGYSKENCKWATRLEQNLNRRNAFLISFNGKTQNLSLWVRELNLSYSLIYSRILKGWDPSKALSTPCRPHK